MSATSTSKLTIPERLQLLKKAKDAPSPAPKNAKIQKVAHYLRKRKNFSKHYSPKLVSFGPSHYGDEKLQPGEEYKSMWAANYIDSANPQDLHTKVQNMESLKPLFDDDLFIKNTTFPRYQEQGFGTRDEMISWTLFVDGCALLWILEHAKLDKPAKMNVKVDQLVLVMQDVLLLENQLPFPLLKHLWMASEKELIEAMTMFLRCHHWATKNEEKVNFADEFRHPTHLLDLQRSIILHERKKGKQTQNVPDGNSKERHIQSAPTQNTDTGECSVPMDNTAKRSKTQNEISKDMVTCRYILNCPMA